MRKAVNRANGLYFQYELLEKYPKLKDASYTKDELLEEFPEFEYLDLDGDGIPDVF